MIVEALLNVLFSVVGLIVSLFNFPDMPTQLVSAWDEIVVYLHKGFGFLYFIFEPSVLKATIGFIIGLFVVEKGIDLVLWVWNTIHGTGGGTG